MSKTTKMSKNPVNEHFVYNDETRKSTCKECNFDMAGRHSENLMRHLKRKHSYLYEEVMEKRRQRKPNQNQNLNQNQFAGTLPSMVQFVDPQHLFMKLSPSHVLNSMQESNDEEEESISQRSNDKFEQIFIGKAEVAEEEDQMTTKGGDLEDSRFLGASAATSTPLQLAAATPTAKPLPITDDMSPDDVYFLQYLGNKFGKYSARTKNTVQFQINRILYKADMGCFDNPETTKMSDSDLM